MLPEPSPNVVDVEVDEGGFVEAAHSSVVEDKLNEKGGNTQYFIY